MLASLPEDVREAIARGDEAALMHTREALPTTEQQMMLAALHFLQEQAGEEREHGEMT